MKMTISNKESVYDILQDYLEERRNSPSFSEQEYRLRLRKLRMNEDRIDETMLEMDNEWDNEVLALIQRKKGRRIFIVGLIVTIVGMIIAILSASNLFMKGQIGFYAFGGIGAALVATFKGYNDLKMYELRKNRLSLKWKNWH